MVPVIAIKHDSSFSFSRRQRIPIAVISPHTVHERWAIGAAAAGGLYQAAQENSDSDRESIWRAEGMMEMSE